MLLGSPYTLGYAVLNEEFLAAFRTGAACYEDSSHQEIEDETRATVRANDAVLVKFKLSFPLIGVCWAILNALPFGAEQKGIRLILVVR